MLEFVKSACRAAALVLGASSLFVSAVQAQSPLAAPPPTNYSLDPRGVDLISGKVVLTTLDASIGDPGAGGLSYVRTYVGGGWRDNATGTVEGVTGGVMVSFGGQSEEFALSGSTYTPVVPMGSTLTKSGSVYTYTARDGTIALFSATASSPYGGGQARGIRITSLTRPSGDTLTYDYYSTLVPKFVGDDPFIPVTRLETITSNSGYRLTFGYQESEPPSQAYIPQFYQIGAVSIENLAIDGVSTAYYASGAVTRSGITTTYGFSSDGLTSIRRPTSSGNDINITYDGSGRVQTWSDNGNTWNYAYSLSGTTLTTTVTNPLSQVDTYVSNTSTNRLTSYKNALNETTSYLYDTYDRVTRATLPEGNYTEYVYDTRGNVTTTTNVAKPASGLADIVTSADYPTTCSNRRTCNQPTSTTDARNGVTDYTYDSVHGGVLTQTEPPPTTGAVRPQTRYTYQSLYAWYTPSYGSGVLQAPTPVTRPTAISRCLNTASCIGTADEQISSMIYGASGVPNNRQMTVLTTRAGDFSLTTTQRFTYTPKGDIATFDSPIAGSADTTTFRYDTARRRVGVIGPDPDGAGPLLRRAVRTTPNQDGQATLAEQGTVTGTTTADWAAFVSLQQVATTYDTWGRTDSVEMLGGGTVHAVQQISYDALGRVDCNLIRMNPATFGSAVVPCVGTAPGPYGPDRISRTSYDAAGRVQSITTGYLTTAAETESATYTDNGQPLTLTDGEGNVSTYEYDGFDRLYRIRYPNASGGGSSATDYEAYGYDAASNVINAIARGGNVFVITYDALNRPTFIDAPAGTSDATYAYDNLGHVLTATTTQTLTNTWDALGRQTSQGGPLGTLSYEYDAAGRRTRLTWPDAFYATYEYDLYNGVTAIRENGATTGPGVLATYEYDNLGRRTELDRGNTAVTTYGYDAVSRLSSLTQNLASTAYDQTLTFGSYNPASQIISRTASNDAYAWTGGVNAALDYTNNGKNQVTVVEAQTITYDARQNITGDGTATYAYNALNQMLTATLGGTTRNFSYDPAGRLYRSVGATTTRYLYDGVDLVMELDAAGTILRRHVPGPGMDEPVVTYEGATTTDRRWLFADERGSIIASANASAVGLNRNSYDEYGVPGSSNTGRFQYTGQTWLPEAGLYYYKARMYDPELGRFLQTDPIGYAAGANLYAYVGSDPVNWTDPTGMVQQIISYCTGGYSYTVGIDVFTVAQTCTYSSFGDSGGGYGPATNPGDIDVIGRGSGGGSADDGTTLGDVAQRFVRCAADQYGLTSVLAGTGIIGGMNSIPTRAKLGAGATAGTSLASVGARAIFGDAAQLNVFGRAAARFSTRLPSATGAVARLGSRFVGPAVGRAIPIVGWAFLAYDAASIAYCTATSE